MVESENNLSASGRKRVLYVEASYPKGDIGYLVTEEVNKRLEERFDTCFLHDLGWHVFDFFKMQKEKGKTFNGMVTHIPPVKTVIHPYGLLSRQYYERCYGASLGIIQQFKDIEPKMVVVAYTGMSNSPGANELLAEAKGIDLVIKKTRDWQGDAIRISEELERRFNDGLQ